MTMTETRPSAGSTDPETRQVEDALDALLAANDPKTVDNVAFRGARYDAGLAWVHFPSGFGGLGVRPDLQKRVESRLRANPRSKRMIEWELKQKGVGSRDQESFDRRR